MKLKMSKEVDLGKEPIGHLLLILALPSITSQVVNALYNMVDRMYIGHIPEIGSAALTGVGVCFPLIMIISAFAYLLGMGGAPRASICMGRKDNKGAEKIMGNCFSSLIIVSIILTAVVLIFQDPLLYLFGASENTIGYAKEYITIYAIGTIFVQLTLGINSFISAQGFSTISMMEGNPERKFTLEQLAKSACMSSADSLASTFLRLKKENLRIDMKVLAPCIALGVAPFAMQATESVLVLCFNSSLLRYGGDLAVGAMTILSSVMQFAMLPLQGLTQGGQPIISYNYGAMQAQRVKKAFRLQTIACFTYSSLLWAAVELCPSLFVAIFTNEPQLSEITVWALRIYMAAVLLMGIQVSCQQTFIAFGNSKISAFLAVFRKIIVLIPLIFILPQFMQDDVFAVFLAEPIADTIAVITTATLFAFEFKKVIRKMQEDAHPASA